MKFWTTNLQALAQRTDENSQTLHRELKDLPVLDETDFPFNRRGEPIPWVTDGEKKIPLASLYDPGKEAQRWTDEVRDGGALWVWGLASKEVWNILCGKDLQLFAVEPRREIWHRSLSCADWTGIIAHPRWVPFFLDLTRVAKTLGNHYTPLVDGPFQTKDWRVLAPGGFFDPGVKELKKALEDQGADLSTQARLAPRWYRNTLLNLQNLRKGRFFPPAPATVAIAGAGPGLEGALENPDHRSLIEGRPHNGFQLFTTDTALGTLQARGIKPDLVLTIDGQLASYHHFVPPLDPTIPILADLAALPLVPRLPNPVFFFLSSHPLHAVIHPFCPDLPRLDTSLGNVAGLGLRFAEFLGSRRTLLWGMDFSYPQGKTYARDTYITPYFLRRSSRLTPLEAQLAAFAWRTDRVIRDESPQGFRYTNDLLVRYKQALEQQSATFCTPLEAFPGPGLALNLTWSGSQNPGQGLDQQEGGDRVQRFLRWWQDSLVNLREPPPGKNLRDFFAQRHDVERSLWAALFPLAAWLVRKNQGRGHPVSPGTAELFCLARDQALASLFI